MQPAVRVAFGAGVVAGAAGALIIGLWGQAPAAPPELTRHQLRQVEAVNVRINRSHPHADPSGRGLCWKIALLKRQALQALGFRKEAMKLRIVSVPGPPGRPSWQATHTLLDVHGVVDGRPWKVALDMTADHPLDPEAERRLGYRTIAHY